mgnify:CR=1 FL=1
MEEKSYPDLGPDCQVLEEIGSGAMGRVFKGKEILLDRFVAIKTIAPNLLESEESLRRFLREARLSAQLSHANIVQLYFAKQTLLGSEMSVVIVSEFVQGCTLKEYMRQNSPLPRHKCLGIIRQLCDALAYAHDEGVIHRDVKAENILLAGGEKVKVADFGLAREIESSSTLTKEGTILGTPLYMAPEQIRGQGSSSITPAVDVYSTGVLLYLLLTGRHPFWADSYAEVLQKQLNQNPKRPSFHDPSIPRRLDNLIMASLRKSPGSRIRSMEEFREKLERISCSEEPSRGVSPPLGDTIQDRSEYGAISRQVESVAPLATKVGEPSPVKGSFRERLWMLTKISSLLIPLLVLLILPFYSRFWPEPSNTAKAELFDLRIERSSPNALIFTWKSSEEYVARLVIGEEEKLEPYPSKEHRLLALGLAPRSLEIDLYAGDKLLQTLSVEGTPKLLDGPFLYPRRCSADIDWVIDFPSSTYFLECGGKKFWAQSAVSGEGWVLDRGSRGRGEASGVSIQRKGEDREDRCRGIPCLAERKWG